MTTFPPTRFAATLDRFLQRSFEPTSLPEASAARTDYAQFVRANCAWLERFPNTLPNPLNVVACNLAPPSLSFRTMDQIARAVRDPIEVSEGEPPEKDDSPTAQGIKLETLWGWPRGADWFSMAFGLELFYAVVPDRPGTAEAWFLGVRRVIDFKPGVRRRVERLILTGTKNEFSSLTDKSLRDPASRAVQSILEVQIDWFRPLTARRPPNFALRNIKFQRDNMDLRGKKRASEARSFLMALYDRLWPLFREAIMPVPDGPRSSEQSPR